MDIVDETTKLKKEMKQKELDAQMKKAKQEAPDTIISELGTYLQMLNEVLVI